MTLPPDPDALEAAIDEVLSASLDGETDLVGDPRGLQAAVAASLGADPVTIPDDGVLQARLDTLAAARNAMTVAPLDELTRRRLVRAALDAVEPDTSATEATHTPTDRGALTRQRRVGALGVVAALVLIVVGVMTVRSDRDGGDTSTNVAASRATGSTSPTSPAADAQPMTDGAAAADLGDVSSPEALARAVRARVATVERTTGDATPDPQIAPRATTSSSGPEGSGAGPTSADPAPGTAGESSPPSDGAAFITSTDAAVACLPDADQAGGPMVLGTGRYGDLAVVVIVTTRTTGDAPTAADPTGAAAGADPLVVVAHVVDPLACTVIATQQVPARG